MDDSVISAADRRIGRGRVADRILDDLRERILSGTLPDGSRLPAERDLAGQYGVSGSTVREALRALATLGLVDIKHGAGMFVTAAPDTLVGMSLVSQIRLGRIGATEVLGLLGALNRHAAQLAARAATDAEIASLRDTAEQLVTVDEIDSTMANVRTFLWRLPEISHNTLVIPLCRLLGDVQVELALELSGGQVSEWRRVAGGLHADRLAIVQALEDRSAQRAADAVDDYTVHTEELIFSTAQAKKIRRSDPDYAELLAGLLNARIASATS